jgi:hypothetical protein
VRYDEERERENCERQETPDSLCQRVLGIYDVVDELLSVIGMGPADASPLTGAPSAPFPTTPVSPRDPNFANLDRLQVAAISSAMLTDRVCRGICPGMVRGFLIHAGFRGQVATLRAIGYNYRAEVSYRNGDLSRWGTRGSVRADAIYGQDARRPIFAVELKTGGAYSSNREFSGYQNNLPGGTKLYVIISVR